MSKDLLRIGRRNSIGLLSANTIYFIAAIAMTIDHAKHFGILTGVWPNIVGRIALPIFIYFIIEGYHKTHNLYKYATRLLIVAIISEVPFNIMCANSLYSLNYQNTIFELLISLMAVIAVQNIKHSNICNMQLIFNVFVIFSALILSEALNFDYGIHGVLLAIAFEILYNSSIEKIGIAFSIWLIFGILYSSTYTVSVEWLNTNLTVQSFSLLAIIPLWLYNGTKGFNLTVGDCSKIDLFQYFKYLFYPAHLIVLYIIKLAIT